MTSPEEPLRVAIATGDRRRAIELCAQTYGAALGRLCLAFLGSQSEADDAAQEALLAAYRGFDAYEGRSTPRAWLFGIARKTCLKQLERRATHRRMSGATSSARSVSDASANEDAANGEELVLLQQRALHARRAVSELRPTEREALLLRYVSELSYEEIAAACQIDEAAVRKRVSRALQRLRELVRGAEPGQSEAENAERQDRSGGNAEGTAGGMERVEAT